MIVTPETEIFPGGVIQSGNKIALSVRILSDICLAIVPCISSEMSDEWYFSSNIN